MHFNEELAMAGSLELTDSELETAHGGWGSEGYEWVWDYYRHRWELIPVEPNYWGGWDGGWGGGWGGGRGGDWNDDRGGRRNDKGNGDDKGKGKGTD